MCLRISSERNPQAYAAVRQALLGAVDQAEAMTAIAGTDRALWHDGIGLFPAGTPFANDAGIEVLRRPRDYVAVRQALARAGYNGETIVVVAPTDAQSFHALSLAGTDQLRRAGMNVDLQEMELAASIRKRQRQAAPDKGGWNAFFGLIDSLLCRTQDGVLVCGASMGRESGGVRAPECRRHPEWRWRSFRPGASSPAPVPSPQKSGVVAPAAERDAAKQTVDQTRRGRRARSWRNSFTTAMIRGALLAEFFYHGNDPRPALCRATRSRLVHCRR
jgi:hypothetical protein